MNFAFLLLLEVLEVKVSDDNLLRRSGPILLVEDKEEIWELVYVKLYFYKFSYYLSKKMEVSIMNKILKRMMTFAVLVLIAASLAGCPPPWWRDGHHHFRGGGFTMSIK